MASTTDDTTVFYADSADMFPVAPPPPVVPTTATPPRYEHLHLQNSAYALHFKHMDDYNEERQTILLIGKHPEGFITNGGIYKREHLRKIVDAYLFLVSRWEDEWEVEEQIRLPIPNTATAPICYAGREFPCSWVEADCPLTLPINGKGMYITERIEAFLDCDL